MHFLDCKKFWRKNHKKITHTPTTSTQILLLTFIDFAKKNTIFELGKNFLVLFFLLGIFLRFRKSSTKMLLKITLKLIIWMRTKYEFKDNYMGSMIGDVSACPLQIDVLVHTNKKEVYALEATWRRSGAAPPPNRTLRVTTARGKWKHLLANFLGFSSRPKTSPRTASSLVSSSLVSSQYNRFVVLKSGIGNFASFRYILL